MVVDGVERRAWSSGRYGVKDGVESWKTCSGVRMDGDGCIDRWSRDIEGVEFLRD